MDVRPSGVRSMGMDTRPTSMYGSEQRGGTERPDAGNGHQPARTLLQTLTNRTFTSECDNAYIVDSPGSLMVLS